MSNIAHILTRQAATRPHAPAITQRRRRGDLTLSYSGLETRAAAEAHRLARSGLEAGDRALVLCPVGIELYVTVLALLRSGGIATFVDPGAGLRRLGACCALAKPKAVIASPPTRLLRPLIPSLWFGPRWLSAPRADEAGPPRRDPPPPDPLAITRDHPALLTFTSGSTGQPKAVVRTHRFLAAQQRALTRDLELAPGQTDLSTMPMFVLANLAAGVHSVLADADLARPGAADPRRLIAQIARHRPDRMLASPALLDRLAHQCLADGTRLDSLRRVHTGGAPVFPRTIDNLRRTAPDARIIAVYGSTEAEPIALLDATRPAPALRRRIASGAGLPAGRLTPDLDLRLLRTSWPERIGPFTRDQFEARSLPAGSVGEIVVRGERVIRGYLGAADDGHTKFTVAGESWHRTGDLGRFDEDGRLWLLGRAAGRPGGCAMRAASSSPSPSRPPPWSTPPSHAAP